MGVSLEVFEGLDDKGEAEKEAQQDPLSELAGAHTVTTSRSAHD